MLCILRYKVVMARKPRVRTKSSSLIATPQELVRYLNEPPQQTDLYGAIRAVARYFAGAENLRFLNTAAAMLAIEEAANRAMDGVQIAFGPLAFTVNAKDSDEKRTVRESDAQSSPVSLGARWDLKPVAYYDKEPAKAGRLDDSMALGLGDYLAHEIERRRSCGRGWKPRIRVCSLPDCENFYHDGSAKQIGKVCSARCRVALGRMR